MERKNYTFTVERERPNKDAPFKHVKTGVKLEASTLEEFRAVLSLYGFEPKNMNASFGKDLSARGLNAEQCEVFNACPIGAELYNFHNRNIKKNGHSKIRGSKMQALNDFLARYGGNAQKGYKVQPKTRKNAKTDKQKPMPIYSTKTIAPEAVGAYLEKIQLYGGKFWAIMFDLKDMFYITEKLKKAKAENTNLVIINVWYERLQIIYNHNPPTNETPTP